MKTPSVLILVVFVFCFVPVYSVEAQTPSISVPEVSISPYAGAKLGFMLVSETGLESTVGGSVYGGVDFADINFDLGEGIGSFQITLGGEAELTSTLIPGDVDFGLGMATGDWKALTLSGLGTAMVKISNRFYVKGRLGLLFLFSEVYGADNTDWGLTGGIGCGLSLTENGSVEVDITGLAENLGYFSAGYRHTF